MTCPVRIDQGATTIIDVDTGDGGIIYLHPEICWQIYFQHSTDKRLVETTMADKADNVLVIWVS